MAFRLPSQPPLKTIFVTTESSAVDVKLNLARADSLGFVCVLHGVHVYHDASKNAITTMHSDVSARTRFPFRSAPQEKNLQRRRLSTINYLRARSNNRCRRSTRRCIPHRCGPFRYAVPFSRSFRPRERKPCRHSRVCAFRRSKVFRKILIGLRAVADRLVIYFV